jgi:V/A-type H+-transporting ATPase subunit I
MLQTEKFGKFTLAISNREIEAALFLIASRSIAQIKEITELPRNLKQMESEMFKIESEDKQDYNVRDFKIHILEKKLTEIGENLDFIIKKLGITSDPKLRTSFEFHVKDLDDLTEKLSNSTRDLYVKIQQLFNNQIANENAIDANREKASVFSAITSNFDFKKQFIDDLKFIDLRLVIINSKNVDLLVGELESNKIFYYDIRLAEPNVLLIIAAQRQAAQELTRKMDLYNAKAFTISNEDFSEEGLPTLDKMRAQLESFRKEKEQLHVDLQQIKQDIGVEIVAMKELYLNAVRFLHNHEKMQFFKDFVIAEFWVRVKDWPHLETELKNAFEERIQYNFHPVERESALIEHGQEGDKKEQAEQPPSFIQIPKILQPYTTILKLYGLPQYSELNPLIFIFFSFPLLFGLMFGDVGQGAVLIPVGLVIAYMMRHRPGYHNLGLIISWCGVGAIVGGLLYGDVFGMPIINLYIGGVKILPVYRPFESSIDAMALLKFTIWIGTFQMSTGFFLRMYNHALVKHYYLIFVDPIPKLLILWDFWIAIQIYGLNITLFMSPKFLFSMQGIILIGSVLAVVFGQLIGKIMRVPYLRKKGAGGLLGEQAMDIFETFLSFLSNALSYTRIFAMTMVHLGFIFAVNLIAMQVAGVTHMNDWNAVRVIVYSVGNGLVMALELILVIIQNIRLHFYEFFSKFYSGGGKEFSMLKYDVRFSKLFFDDSESFIIAIPNAKS